MNIRRIIGGILQANGYVISSRGSRDCYIIDPGYNGKQYIHLLEEEQLNPLGIFLTHHHSDHSGAVDFLRRELDCPVLLHRLDADAYGREVDSYLEGGEILALGDEKGQVIHTPGHTRGGCCLCFERPQICFTGDTIFNVDLGRTDLEDGSPEEMENSIRTIIDQWKDGLRIYPGHGDDCTMGTVRRINHEFQDIVGR